MQIQKNNIYEANINCLNKSNSCQNTIKKFFKIISVINDFSILSFSRSLIHISNHILSPNKILQSAELTLFNIENACKHYCLSDANILLRKYRDDLFFFLYITLYQKDKIKSTVRFSKLEKTILLWAEGKLKNLSWSAIISFIGEYPDISNSVEKYKLKQAFDKIGQQLNNFVHGNGFKYYNKTFFDFPKEEYAVKELEDIYNHLNFITITFFFLLTLCNPQYISSTDYEDFIEYNIIPPSDCQYWIAPFLEDYLKKNLSLLDKNCLDYLKNNTSMKFN